MQPQWFGMRPLRLATRSLPVWVLGITQIVSWGTLYYAFSVFLHPTGAAQSWTQEQMVAAWSLSLLVSGICAYPVGRLIHRFGGRGVMSVGSVLAASAFGVLSMSESLATFYVAWAIAGVAMAATLYEAAFSVLAGFYNSDYKRAITTVTLAGGFASTVFWPLTERLIAWLGWREAALIYVGLHLAVCLPLHWFGLPRPTCVPASNDGSSKPARLANLIRVPAFWLLGACYMLNGVVFSVVSVHLIPLLQSRGLSAHEAAWLAACAGPMQVFGRLVEFRFGHRWKAAQTGKVALMLVLPALLGLSIWPVPMLVVAFAVGLYGISNGVMTIVRSVSVAAVFGRESYAWVNGALMGPALVSRAFGPLLAATLVERTGRYEPVLFMLGCFGLISLALFSAGMRMPVDYV